MSGNNQPWVPFYPSDWLAGTRGMSAVETGVYITLLMTMYERAEPVQRDDARVARLCGLAMPTFRKIVASLIVQRKVTEEAGGLWNSRASLELKKRDEISAAARQSASVRWSKKPSRNNGRRDANAMPSHSERNANYNHTIPPKSPKGEFVSVRQDDPLVPLLEKQRGRPFIFGTSGAVTVTAEEAERARRLP